jgi:hypothetical protein
MAQPNPALTSPQVASPEPPEDRAWKDLQQLLRRAAQLSAERGVDSDRFMEAAWAACLEARPGLREALEDKELRAQLKKLRKRGLIAEA